MIYKMMHKFENLSHPSHKEIGEHVKAESKEQYINQITKMNEVAVIDMGKKTIESYKVNIIRRG